MSARCIGAKCQTCGADLDLSDNAMMRIAFSNEDWRTVFCNQECRDAAVVTIMVAAEMGDGNDLDAYGIDAGTREAVAAMVPLDEDAAPPEPEDEFDEDDDP